jgi:hypothetical protein
MIRTALLWSLLACLCSVSLAGEVTLEPTDFPGRQSLALLENGVLCIEPLKAPPDGAKAPPGEPTWGRLRLGESAYLVCVVMDAYRFGKAYVDRDNDLDLAEEEPVLGEPMGRIRARLSCFEVKGLAAKFRVGGKLLSAEMAVRIEHPFHLGMRAARAWSGVIAELGSDCRISWVPGQKPLVSLRAITAGSTRKVYFGRKTISFGQDCVTLRDGKVVVSYTVSEDRDLVPVPVSRDFLSLSATRDSETWTVHKPVGGSVFVAKGRYFKAEALFLRKAESDEWLLSLAISNLSVKPGLRFGGSVEPLSILLRVQQIGGAMEIWPSFVDAAKRKVILYKNREPHNPLLLIKDGKGNAVETKWLGYG